MQCGACGADNPPKARFCAECGARLAAPERIEERKVVSVLFADLVGFTSRSEQLDVEDVRGTLAPFHATLRKVLEGFGGTVEKFIGDAVMAVFGAPIAHEDDPERAVRAGLAIREAIAELDGDLHVRIGINTGEALVSLGADPQSGEGMVAGDVVNTAARLQSAAPIDGVLVGEVTFRAAGRGIVFEAHEPIDAKGTAEPVVCWTAAEARSFTPFATRDSLPFVGRERELHLLVDAFEHSRSEPSVQLVTLVGVPGIGKSRLVAELGAYIEGDADLTTWRHGHILSYGTGVAFFALAEIVKQECGILDSDDGRVVGEKLDTAIGALALEGADARWVRNQVGPLVGLHSAVDGSGQPEAFAGWRSFLEAMAAESPTVLVFEDLHWADDALLDFVDGLVDRVNDVPLLVVATARPELLERRPGWSGGRLNALSIGLAPLSTEHTTALIDEIIDRSLLPADAESILLERAGGNPLYAQEYVRALVERGASADLPETVQGIIAARLDGLSAGEKSLLQDAAVLGTTAWLGAVCSLSEHDRTATDELLRRLERKQLLHRARRSSIAGEIEISFTHALIREVAYSQLPRSARVKRHERAAAWLERVATDRAETAELIAYHYTIALELAAALGNDNEALRPSALNALTAAARQSAAKHDHSATIRYTETALTLRPEPGLQAELLVLRAVASYTAGHPDESVMLEARDRAVANGRRVDAVHLSYLLNEWATSYAADAERSNAYGTEALRLAADLTPGPITTLPAYGRAYDLLIGGQYQEVIELCNAEIARATEGGADAAVGLMLIWRGTARFESGDEDGLGDMRDAARILEEAAHPKAATAAFNLGDMLEGLGRLPEAATAIETALVRAHRSGNRHAESVAQLGLARIAYHRGDSNAALVILDAISSDTSEWLMSYISTTRGHLLLADAPHEAAAAARRPIAYGRRVRNLQFTCDASALAARAALAIGDATAADTFLDDWIGAWTEIGGISACAPSLVEAGVVMAALDRHQELAAAADLVPIATPWTDAARALAERRYADAAAILDSIPSIPLRDAALRL
jgi:class 3 adenylate cyclase